MGLSELILGCSFATAGLLLATATFVTYRALARRRIVSGDATRNGDETRDPQFRRSVPQALALVRAQLNDLADEMDEVLPQKLRLIDQLIYESDREIARLQRRLATAGSASVTLNPREPDVLSIADFEAERIAPRQVPVVQTPTTRSAA
jgi:hypothetical protein